MKDAPNLTRLGHLLIDLKTVCAVVPLRDDPNDDYGFRVLTVYGSLDVKDAETNEAVRQHFYPETV